MLCVKYEVRQDETNHVDSTFERTFADSAERRAWELTQSQHPFLHLHAVFTEVVGPGQAQARMDAQTLESVARGCATLPERDRAELTRIAAGLRGRVDGQQHSVDLAAPVRFYDNRGKSDAFLQMTEVLFVKGAMVLCEARFDGDDALHTVLFDRDSREVLTENFQLWHAENT